MNSPIVSVIVPVYNGENYLGRAIESVLRQTIGKVEIIVVDDGSTDSTHEVVRAYGDRVRYVRQENTGVAGAFNHGLRLVTGRYVSWLSHDDLVDCAADINAGIVAKRLNKFRIQTQVIEMYERMLSNPIDR